MFRKLAVTTALPLLMALPVLADSANPFLKDDFFSDKTTVEAVKAAIAAGADINEENEYGDDALIHAIEGGVPLEVLAYLVEQGADLDQPDPARNRAVQVAAWSPNTLEVLKFLQAAGADMTARDYMAETWASGLVWGDKFDPGLITLAKEAGIELTAPNRCNDTALTGTAWAESDARAWYDALLAEGLDPTLVNCEGMDMYMKSISWGDGTMAEFLYEAAEDPHAANNQGLSGVLLAAQWGVNKERLEFLKAKGYDLTITSPKGENALILSTKWGDVESLKLLLAEGLDINSQSTDGTTPLLMALSQARYIKPDVIKAVVEAGADVNQANAKGETPLLRRLVVDPAKTDAGAEATAELFNWLLGKGADLKAVDAGGATALIYAVKGRQPVAVLEQILAAGVDVNAKDAEGTTALMHAAELASDPAIIELLLKAGADKSVKDVFDDTVAIIAADNKALAGTPVLALLQ